MASNLDRYKGDLERLVSLGDQIALDLNSYVLDDTQLLGCDVEGRAKEIRVNFNSTYQRWYTEAGAVVRQLIPDRLDEFEQLYRDDGRRKKINMTTFTIQDWLNGIFGSIDMVLTRLHIQLQILRAAHGRFESTLFDIRQIIQADLFDSELDAARELGKRGFLRGAGAIAGVVLEKHLAQVAENHTIKMRKKHPTINDYNELLKDRDVLDIPTWRQIQRLSDIRNLCDHNKDRDPTKDEVEELVNGVEKISKTLF